MDLTEFLTARYDEEAVALKRIEDHSEPWRGEWVIKASTLYTYNGWCLAVTARGYPMDPQVLAHIVRYDPSRVAAELNAKREILTLHAPFPNDRDGFICDRCGSGEPYEYPVDWPCTTVKLLASVYSGHPDFDPAWRTE